MNVVRKVRESQRSPRKCNLKNRVHMRTPRGVPHRHHVLASTHAPYSVCVCVWVRMCVRVCRFKPVRSRPKGGVYPGMFQFFFLPPPKKKENSIKCTTNALFLHFTDILVFLHTKDDTGIFPSPRRSSHECWRARLLPKHC